MVTNFLGKDEVHAYLRDFVNRIALCDPLPTLWCPITRSGNALMRELWEVLEEHHPELIEKIGVLPISADDASGGLEIRFKEGQDPAADISGQCVLIFDGAVHSGSTMAKCVDEVLKFEPAAVCTYALVIKRGGSFVPTLWGMMIDETDRAFFLLDQIPNNRLDAGAARAPGAGRPVPLVHIRRLNEAMIERPLVYSEVESMDRATWNDRHFDMIASDYARCTYVMEEKNSTVGYLTVHCDSPGCIAIDEVAVDRTQRDRKLGGVLMRFADTLARQANFRIVRLYAIADKVEFYVKYGYRLISDRPALRLGKEEYRLMERTVLYHQGPFRDLDVAPPSF